jgi:membrane-associated phospholipid phosphatase
MTAITLLALVAAAPAVSAPPATTAPADAPIVTPAAAEPVAPAPVVPSKDPERKTSLEPKAAEARAPGRLTFDVDPFADGSIIAVSLGFAFVLDQINATGEIRPQQISPEFERSQLLGIDRVAIDNPPDESAAARANLGLFIGVGFAVADPILSGMRENNVQTALVDAFLYAESMSLTFALTDMVKIAVRRPRPHAYAEAEKHRDNPSYANPDTDSALSFFSLHSSMTASIGATATYLAFVRSPRTVRPWLTLGFATALATFVSIERVRAGKHFPTDVMAGTVAGAGVGLLVPHLHRTDDIKQRRVWVGFRPASEFQDDPGGLLHISGSL